MASVALTASTWRRRREALFDALGPGILILPTAVHALRNGDVRFEFRPGSDFTYLCGFPEPNAVLVAWRGQRGPHHALLFVPERNREREIWDGRRLGVRGAKAHCGVDRAYPIGALWSRLPELLQGHAKVFWALGRDRTFDERLLAELHKLALTKRRENPPAHPVFEDPGPELAAMRLIKEPVEIALLERSAAITAAGHAAAMRIARPGMFEFQVQAELEAEFRRQGSPRNGYGSIVASGANACILHYHDAERRLRPNDLLLVDAGAEFGGYTTDVTRTFPVHAPFTPAQRAVYSVVLRAQLAGIRSVKPGAAQDAPHRACLRVLTQGLVELGVLHGRTMGLVRAEKFKDWYMHGTSHWLGMDVHDCGPYQASGRSVPLRPGMVLTIEPGLYFQPRDARVPRPLRGIGVRIEDDVLVTPRGNRVLTAAIPKEIPAVESLCLGA